MERSRDNVGRENKSVNTVWSRAKSATKEVVRSAEELFVIVGLCWLPADLLYLYVAGHWCEPNSMVRNAELIALPLFIVLGVRRAVCLLRNAGKEL